MLYKKKVSSFFSNLLCIHSFLKINLEEGSKNKKKLYKYFLIIVKLIIQFSSYMSSMNFI